MIATFSVAAALSSRLMRAPRKVEHRFHLLFLAAFSWWGAAQGFGPALQIALSGVGPVSPYVGDRPGPFTPAFFGFLALWLPAFALAGWLGLRARRAPGGGAMIDLARAWSFVDTQRAHAAWPATLLPGALDEPVLLTRDRVLSNVCTHRAACLLEAPTDGPSIRCPYHGRRFRLDGTVSAAPGFDVIPDEPLPALASASIGPMRFASIDPESTFEALVGPTRDRLSFFPWGALTHDPESDRSFTLEAPWPLWVENYLEGLHIPYVHPSLTRALDLTGYTTELFERSALQIGDAADGEPAFDLPLDHPDARRRVGGYYLFLWPLTALNLYPWGVSLNAVQPLGSTRTRVVYRAYVSDPA